VNGAATAFLFLALALQPAPPASGPLEARTVVLDNGLTVTVLACDSQPLVATQLWYHVGSADEEPGARGLAHLFEHLMFGDTERYADAAYERHHHRYGGYENAYTSPDETVYVSQIDPAHHARVLEMEAARMRGLVLAEDALDKEKKVVEEELRRVAENDPVHRVAIAALGALLGDHPYAVTPLGTEEQIESATLERCRSFYDRYYRPGNAHLVVAGPVDIEAELDEVRKLFGPIPAGPTPRREIPPLVGRSFPGEVVLRENLPPVETAILAFPLPPAGSADDWAVRVMVQLLSGSAVDPFREELVTRRDKALDAGVYPFRFRRAGALLFYSVALPYRRKTTAFRFMERSLETLARLEWVTDESVRAARQRLVREALESRFFSDRLAEGVGQAGWWYGRPELALHVDEKIRAVTVADVAAAFRRYVVATEPARLYIRPEHVPLGIRMFSWLYPVLY